MRDRRQRETELVDCWRQKARGRRRGEWLVGERGGEHSDRVSVARTPTDRRKSQRAELTLLSASPMRFLIC